MQTVLMMQVRSASTRLPGKALLPVAGYPSCVLAALRAANCGHEIRVATTTDTTDDLLVKIFEEQKIRVSRGPKDDVLARFVLAAHDLPDECLLVRLTADNLVPDGQMVKELASDFAQSGVEYLYHSCPESHLPYGLGAEAFTVGTLRTAHVGATTSYDREHVIPWIARNCPHAIHIPRGMRSQDWSHLRCTIDDHEDYERVCHLFAEVEDPVQIGWVELAQKLSEMPGESKFRVGWKTVAGRAHSELALGTAQLGMEYGIANKTGKPPRSVVAKIIRSAIAHGVTSIDTARTYGDSEEILGDVLSGAWRSRVEVVTKLDSLSSPASDASLGEVRAAVDQSVRCSCEALGVVQLTTLLLHRWEHRQLWDGAVWQRLLELHEEGIIGNLGASVYEPNQVLAALEEPEIRHLQIPMNVIDWRWKAAGVDRALAQRPEVVVHARSALLQGLLADSGETWPSVTQVESRRWLHLLRELARRFDRESVVDLCFAYVRSQSWITSVVVGCETVNQLEQNLAFFHTTHLTTEQCTELEASLPVASEELLNPSKWNFVHERSA